MFSTYNETGIQWTDHTLILSNEGSLKQGLTTGQSIIKEVAIAAGNSNSRKVYFGIEFDKNSEEFVFYPSGGYYGSGIYTGTYADEPTGGYYVYENYGQSGPSGPSGPHSPTGPQSTGYATLITGFDWNIDGNKSIRIFCFMNMSLSSVIEFLVIVIIHSNSEQY